MEKTVELKDGSKVVIRPLMPDDAERFYWFLGGLSEEDRRYLRTDVRDRDLIVERTRNADPDLIAQLIAENGEEICGGALLETPGHGWWDADIGEIRVFVGSDHRRKGLGFRLAREIYFMAVEKRLRKIMARIMRPQRGARKIFRRLGFMEEAILPDYVKDLEGQVQDLIVMTADLEDLKRELKAVFESDDWRRHR